MSSEEANRKSQELSYFVKIKDKHGDILTLLNSQSAKKETTKCTSANFKKITKFKL